MVILTIMSPTDLEKNHKLRTSPHDAEYWPLVKTAFDETLKDTTCNGKENEA
jgi:hypothetical protein